MTVCIAAMCENGKRIVSATDGMLSCGDLTSDVMAPKMWWSGDRQFLVAGDLGQCDLVLHELSKLRDSDPQASLRTTLTAAFHKRRASWSADAVVSPFGLDAEQFIQQGRQIMGETLYGDYLRRIEDLAQRFDSQVIGLAWGHAEHAATICTVTAASTTSHVFDGFAAIGSGAYTAISTLLLLGQNRSSSLEDTIYTVAAAKFASEACVGVGHSTVVYVSRKRSDGDPVKKPVGSFLESGEIQVLRDTWEASGRPRIPTGLFKKLAPVVQRLGGSPSLEVAFRDEKHAGN